MSGAVAIFVKTPGRSALKTRLAADVGRTCAEQWYRLAATAVASVVKRACMEHAMTAYWAVAEADAERDWPELPTIVQGDGGLGERMARVHAQLVAAHGFALLIGADAPQLSADALGEAAQWLAADATRMTSSPVQARLVLGPASDGGFWLFGSNQKIEEPIWSSVRYSRADTAQELQRAMQTLGSWRMLDELTDVDHAGDLDGLRAALAELPDGTAEQLALQRWMDSHITAAIGCTVDPRTSGA